jgi:DNA repair exonuclease SbcCD ATPase subunit
MNEYQTLKLDLVMVNNEIARINRELSSVKINDKCSTCGQTIDNSHLLKIQNDLHHQLAINTSSYNGGLASARAWSTELEATQAASKAYKLNQDAIHRFEQLTQLIDKAIPNVYPDHKALTDEKQILKNKLDSQTQQLKEVTDYNKRVSAHNAKVDALKEQKSDFTIRQTAIKADILDKSAQSNALSILKKAFSTSGIVAFKLENLTKELETTINYYLSVLSDGQFQIEFSLDKEKLNINVINNGISAPIETMSGGEFSRIQTSILLAIRILLSKLGGSSINLLFLDEITGVLDSEGKEKLIEVLQAEEELNVFLISHDFTHPLIDKVSIIKENNISCIQS